MVVAFWVVVLAGAFLYHRSHSGAGSAGTPAGPGNTNPTLLEQQGLNVQWQNEGGTVMLTGAWTNSSAITIISAVVECDQTDTGGNLLVKNDVTLMGPVAPNITHNFMRVRLAAISPATTNIACTIVSVKPD